MSCIASLLLDRTKLKRTLLWFCVFHWTVCIGYLWDRRGRPTPPCALDRRWALVKKKNLLLAPINALGQTWGHTRTTKSEAGESVHIQGQPRLHRTFQVRQSYRGRTWLEINFKSFFAFYSPSDIHFPIHEQTQDVWCSDSLISSNWILSCWPKMPQAKELLSVR